MEPSISEPDEEAVRAQARVGALIAGKWKVERVLGIGGMATVYQAVHEHNGRKVALKILHDHLCHLDDVRERFMQEAHAANRIQHKGAVLALDDGELENGAPYLVLDFLEGQSLDRRWRKNNQLLSVEEVFAVAEQLLDVLESAHKNGVLHRDIKPENVFLTDTGEVKLLDFGISHVTGVDRTHKTELGSMMGTPAFMAPEQARGRWGEMDARSDIFAVGASMYTLVSGHTIHDAETANELLLKVMTERVADVRKVAPHVPDKAAKVINRAVSFYKEDRYQSAFDMKVAVAAVNETLGGGFRSYYRTDGFGGRSSTIPPGMPSQVSTYRPVISSEPSAIPGRGVSRRILLAGAAALLMTLTAAFSYHYFRTPSPVKTITFSPVADAAKEGDFSALDVSSKATNQPGASTGITLEEIESSEALVRKRQAEKSRAARSWVPRKRPASAIAPKPSPTSAAIPLEAQSSTEAQTSAEAQDSPQDVSAEFEPAQVPETQKAPAAEETPEPEKDLKTETVFDPLSRRR